MNINRYNLPLDHKYILIGTEAGSIENGDGQACENCGTFIVNVATVKTEEDKIYRIGLDCAETLSFCDYSDRFKLMEEIKKIQRMKTYLREFKKLIANNEFSIVHYHSKKEGFDFITTYKQAGIITWTPSKVYARMPTEIYNTYFQQTLDKLTTIQHDYE